jgi:hypothetical protein
MKTYFSKRHADALRDKKLSVSFSKPLRTSIVRILDRFSVRGGWNDQQNFTFDEAVTGLLTFYGKEQLEAFDEKDKRVSVYFEGFIKGGYPSEVLDAIEAWFDMNPDSACERELNDCLAMNNSSWRVVTGQAMLINSEYLHTEVRVRTLRLLKDGDATGALEEFQEAVSDLQAGETKDAIVKAHKSIESVMKTALGTSEHLTFGKLLEHLLKGGLIPTYYQEFLVHFEKLALGAVKERNRPGTGHGQGNVAIDVPRSLAEFVVNLAGAINLFIIERWMETKGAAKGGSSSAKAKPRW